MQSGLLNAASLMNDKTFGYAFIKKPLLLSLATILSVAFAFGQAPTVTGFTPASGPAGTSVTITGTNFNAAAASNIVFFGATMATITAAGTTSLTVTVPSGATYQPISVLNSATALAGYSATPFVSTFTPNKGNITSADMAPKVDFAGGSNPYSIAIGDLDGDGKPDLAVVNQGANTVSVFRNTSASGSITATSFAAKVDFATGSYPVSVVIGDFDGDGKPDLAVANYLGSTVSILRNTSSSGSITVASFAAHVDFATGKNPYSIAAGDIDGDGKPDLALADQGGNTVSVLRNTSTSGSITTASFAARVDLTTGNYPLGVAIGDLDGDGKPDLAVVNGNSGTVSVFRNISSSGSIKANSFAARVDFATGSFPYSIAIGDLDGDGKPDLAVANYYDATVSVLRNTSTTGSITASSFAAQVDFATGTEPNRVAIGDLDGDGKPELAVTSNFNSTVSVFHNNASSGSITAASFAARVDFATGNGPESVAIGDLDGDGMPDLAVVSYNDNKVSVLRNNPLFGPALSSLSAVGASLTNASNVNYTATFGGAVSGLTASNFSITASGVTGASVGTPVTGDGGITWTVPVSTGAGDGTIQLSLANATAVLPGISTAVPFAGDTYTIDKTPPTIIIGAPSVATIGAGGPGMVSYTATYADANFNVSNLTNSGITLNTTGTATGTVNVTGGGTSYTVTISSITGLGTLGISVGAGYTSDLAGNTDPGAGPSTLFNVTNESTDAILSNLSLDAGPLTPGFSPGVNSYMRTLVNGVNAVTIVPTADDAGATILINGTDGIVSGATSNPIPVWVGSNIITVQVTAADGTTTQTYTLTLVEAGASNDLLTSLALSKGVLSPAFAGTNGSYTASVVNNISSVAITPVTADPYATVTVNGTPANPGTAFGPISLAPGPNVIITTVTAQNDTATRTYTVTVTRALSSNDKLQSLRLSTGTLSPAFTRFTTSGYTDNAVNGVQSITITPTAVDAGATLLINGTMPITSGGTSGPIALAVGPNIIAITVTAADGANQDYTVTVTRAPSDKANLFKLGPSIGGLTPAFTSTNTTYTIAADNSRGSITLTPVSSDANAIIKVNGTAVISGMATAPIALAEGAQTVISTVVTAQNGTTAKTYTLTVTRAPSSNATLSRLGPSIGGLTPAFTSTNTSYTIAADNSRGSITLTPVSGDANATIQVNGTTVTSGTVFGPIALAPGPNTITTVVTAQDSTTTKTYTLTVTRAASGADSYDPGISVTIPIAIGTIETPTLVEDGIQVRQGVSPNGDGINDFLQIDNIIQYPDNKLAIMNRNGQLVFETSGYDNSSKVFDGHSNKNGQMQLPGTYFYQLDYTVSGVTKHKTGFIVLKY